VLRQVALRLAEVFVAAAAVVSRTEAECRAREEEAARVAAVLGRVDPGSRRRVMSARRAASAAELLAAQSLADEMRYQAGSRALAAVHRFGGTLAVEAAEANAESRRRLAGLGEAIDRLDHTNARALLQVVERAEAQRLATAENQAAELTAQIQAAMGSLPAPPAEFDEVRPRSGKARRARRRKAAADAGSPAEDSADVVVLDPNRRRTAQ
jgi:hypothetical protein